MNYTHLGYVIELRGNVKRLEYLRKVFTRSKKQGVQNLRKAILTILTSMELPTIPGTPAFSARTVENITKDRTALQKLTKKNIEVFARKEGITLQDSVFALRILRGLGLVEVFYRDNKSMIGLTRLGRVVRDFLVKAKVGKLGLKEITSTILASLPFSTKMRVIYGLYYIYGPDLRGFYNTLRSHLFGDNYRGLEKLGLEVLYEIALTRAKSINVMTKEDYISDTHLLITLLESFLELYEGRIERFNEVFKAINMYIRYPHFKDYRYRVAVWEALESETHLELNEVLEKYKLTYIRPLINMLLENFMSIEEQLRSLYGFYI